MHLPFFFPLCTPLSPPPPHSAPPTILFILLPSPPLPPYSRLARLISFSPLPIPSTPTVCPPTRSGCLCCRPRRYEEEAPRPLHQRSCTDCLCLLLFLLFLSVSAAIFIYALLSGDWYAYYYASDYLGNRCGRGAYATARKAFYPRLSRDLIEQSDVLRSSPWDVKLYTLCVESCPSAFDVTNPLLIRDYGYDPTSPQTIALGSGTQATWVSAMATVDLFNRCIPRSSSSSESRELCAFPDCSSSLLAEMGVVCDGEQPNEWVVCPAGSTPANCTSQSLACQVKSTRLAGVAYSSYTNEPTGSALLTLTDTVGSFYAVASALADGSSYILAGGVIAPVVCAYVVMMLLRFAAKLIVYTLLASLVGLLLAAVVLCYARSGIQLRGVDAQSVLATASSNITLTNPFLESLTSVQQGNEWVWVVSFWLMLLLTFVVLLALVLARKQIKLTIAIIVEATKIFSTMPSLMICPAWTVVAQAAVALYSLVGVALLYTTEPQTWLGALDRIPELGSGSYPVASGLERLRQLQAEDVTITLIAVQVRVALEHGG